MGAKTETWSHISRAAWSWTALLRPTYTQQSWGLVEMQIPVLQLWAGADLWHFGPVPGEAQDAV